MKHWLFLALLCGVMLPLSARSEAPTFPKAFAGRAQFETTGGFKEGGWADLVSVRPGSEPFIVSVRRLLGPKGGFDRQTPVAEVISFVRHVKIDSFVGGTNSYLVEGVPVPTPEADPLKRPLADLTVYRVHNDAPLNRSVALAAQAPSVGEVVWLLIKDGDTAVLKSGKVIATRGEDWLSLQLDVELAEKGMIGAPVLNGAGELVGLFSHRDRKDSATLNVIPAAVIAQVLPAS